MKINLLMLSLLTMPLYAEVGTTRLGPVEAIRREVSVKPEDCVKNIRVTSTVYGGAYSASVIYWGECEVKQPDHLAIVLTETYSKTIGNATVTGNAKGYSIKASFRMVSLQPDNKALEEMATATILAEVKPMSYSVNGVRTLEKITR